MSMTQLNSTARDIMSVRAMIAELEAEAEALTDKIKGAMVEQGAEVLQGDGWKASWKNVVSNRFDSKRFKADHAFGIQIQGWIHQCNGPADTVIPIFTPDFIQRPVDIGPALGFLYLREQRQLHNAVRRGQPTGLH